MMREITCRSALRSALFPDSFRKDPRWKEACYGQYFLFHAQLVIGEMSSPVTDIFFARRGQAQRVANIHEFKVGGEICRILIPVVCHGHRFLFLVPQSSSGFLSNAGYFLIKYICRLG